MFLITEKKKGGRAECDFFFFFLVGMIESAGNDLETLTEGKR